MRHEARAPNLRNGEFETTLLVAMSVVNGMGDDVDRAALLQALQIIGKVDAAYVSQEPQDDDE